MEEFNTERKSSELNKEEVNVYTDDCGVTRYNCVTDCFWVLALVTAASKFGKETVDYERIKRKRSSGIIKRRNQCLCSRLWRNSESL